MRYSEWQSGKIAPELSGGYERQDGIGWELCVARYDVATKNWLLLVSGTASQYQINNGHTWKWRGQL